MHNHMVATAITTFFFMKYFSVHVCVRVQEEGEGERFCEVLANFLC